MMNFYEKFLYLRVKVFLNEFIFLVYEIFDIYNDK